MTENAPARRGRQPKLPLPPPPPPSQWPADRVERRKIADLVPYARNSRRHSDAQIDRISASMQKFGWTMPLLIDEQGGLIAGHARVMAASKMGWAEAPVMIAVGWSDDLKRAYVIADNRLAELSTWDDSLLSLELGGLQLTGFDISLTGFDQDALDKMNGVAAVNGSNITMAPAYQILIECADEAEQLRILERLQADGIECRALIA